MNKPLHKRYTSAVAAGTNTPSAGIVAADAVGALGMQPGISPEALILMGITIGGSVLSYLIEAWRDSRPKHAPGNAALTDLARAVREASADGSLTAAEAKNVGGRALAVAEALFEGDEPDLLDMPAGLEFDDDGNPVKAA